MENTTLLMNIIWTMLGAFLVYFMQAGFAMVETASPGRKMREISV